MECETLGQVLVTAKIESLRDLFNVEQGMLSANQVRTVEVTDALVDTGATMLSIPSRYIRQLGLKRYRMGRVRTSAGIVERGMYEAIRLTVQGRFCTVDVCQVPDDCSVLIGQIPLEGLDLVVDTVGRKLIGNPAHGGEHMAENL